MAELSSYPEVTTLAAANRIPVITTPGVAGGNRWIRADNLALFTGGGGSMSAAAILAALLTVDGPGSGLNADLLDGLSSAAFELKPAGVLSLGDYGAVGNGVADDSHAIRDWCLAAAAIASPTNPIAMYAPPGTYKTTVAGATYGIAQWSSFSGGEGVIGVVPSNVRMYGVPQKTWFYMTGIPPTGDPGDYHDSYMMLGVADGSENIIFEDLAFRGENDPFTYVDQNISSCIDIMLSTTHDVEVRRCSFRDLYGFSIHDRGYDINIHVRDCWFYQCANGVNVNAYGSIQTGNFMEDSEGFECSGSRTVIANNVLINAQRSGISMGGASAARYGITIANNVIDGGTGHGIELSDGCFGTVVDGNYVRKTKFIGVRLGTNMSPAQDHCVISNNTTVDCGLISAGNGIGMDISGDNHLILGNMCYDTAEDVLYSQKYGAIIRGSNCFLDGNYFDGATNDIDIANTAVNTRFGQNFYVNDTVGWNAGGTSSVAPNVGWFKATTDKVRDHRLGGDGSGEPYGRFAEFADGKFEWGDAGGARDTNLYRSAADTLKTDDRFKTGASTTGSRPSAATAGDGATWYDTTLKRQITSDGTNWQAYIAATGPSTGWAVSNVTTDKVFDANATTIDELADVLGTLITYLISRGDLAA